MGVFIGIAAIGGFGRVAVLAGSLTALDDLCIINTESYFCARARVLRRRGFAAGGRG